MSVVDISHTSKVFHNQINKHANKAHLVEHSILSNCLYIQSLFIYAPASLTTLRHIVSDIILNILPGVIGKAERYNKNV